MNDDRVVRLLEEMRDLQRQHVDSYREALRNQAESIRLQQEAMKRVRVILILAGIVVFSGSLYALALTGVRVLGAITPLGGLCFLAGWVALALAGRALASPATS